MGEIEWYFPESLDEVPPLLAKEGVIVHGGGTGILRTRMKRVRGLVDLGRLPVHYHRREGGRIELGASLAFAEVVEKLEPGHILSLSLGRSASTPLRNRITVGGSVALFPAWSDIIGPLVALEAYVTLTGERQGVFPITDYLADSSLRKKTLITGVSFPDKNWAAYYYRDTRAHFDYSAFTITILARMDRGSVADSRIVVVGCTGKFRRLIEMEADLTGKTAGDAGSLAYPELSFTAKKFMSSEYLSHCAGVELERGVKALLGMEAAS